MSLKLSPLPGKVYRSIFEHLPLFKVYTINESVICINASKYGATPKLRKKRRIAFVFASIFIFLMVLHLVTSDSWFSDSLQVGSLLFVCSGYCIIIAVFITRSINQNMNRHFVFFHKQRQEAAFVMPWNSKDNPRRHIIHVPWERVAVSSDSVTNDQESDTLRQIKNENPFWNNHSLTIQNLRISPFDSEHEEEEKCACILSAIVPESKGSKPAEMAKVTWNVIRAFMTLETDTVDEAFALADNKIPVTPDVTLNAVRDIHQEQDFAFKAFLLPLELHQWIEPIPESEWKKPSKELAELNARLDTGFAEGKTFEEQMHEILKEQGQEPVRDFRKDKSAPITPIQPKSGPQGKSLAKQERKTENVPT